MTEADRIRYEQYKPAYAAFMKFYPFGLEDLPDEIWADIRGYEGLYQESTYGRTKSLWYSREKILTPKLHTGGYLRVALYKGGRPKDCYVHKLVAETFLPNPDNLPEVNHIVGMKFNCHVSNLAWCTPAENMQHAYDTGLLKSGEDHHESQLTNDEVRLIRKLHVKGDKNFSAAALARMFGVDSNVIDNIVNNKHYRRVK